MTNNPQPGAMPWTAGQKIAFRFLFVFLGLQVLTDNFLALLYGDALMTISKLAQKIFTPPCLWLNEHIFHFNYHEFPGYTFSLSLHTIRDIVYLLLATIACSVWSILDRKRPGYTRLNYWFSQCLIIIVSCMLFSYAIIKVIPVQMRPPTLSELNTPLGELTPFELIWLTLGYGTPFQIFTGIFEALAAVLILFKRTRVAGLLLAVTVILNIIIINYTYQVGVLITSFLLLLITLFLLAPWLMQLAKFFFSNQPVLLNRYEFIPARTVTTRVLKILAIVFVSGSFILNTRQAYNYYAKREKINRSTQHSLVKNFVLNNDTLSLVDKDTLCWRTWHERVRDDKRLVTISTMNRNAEKTFTIERDSLKQNMLLRPFNQPDTTPLHFQYKDMDNGSWQLSGILNNKNILVNLQKIRPDTAMTLLKVKRLVVVVDDAAFIQ